MNPSVDDGNPPRPFRHLRMTEHCTPDPSSSQAPVHSVLVQKSVTTITNRAGRLSSWMLGKSSWIGNRQDANSWQPACTKVTQPGALNPPGVCPQALHRAQSPGYGRV
jgi:hypothetical protein